MNNLLDNFLNNENSCPFCGSENIEMNYSEAEEKQCNSCGKTWSNYYKVAMLEEME